MNFGRTLLALVFTGLLLHFGENLNVGMTRIYFNEGEHVGINTKSVYQDL